MQENTYLKKFALMSEECELALSEVYRMAESTALDCQARVLDAFREARVSAMHMAHSTGYGYDDASRDTLDRVFAYALEAEDAIVRPQFASGTHALYVMISAITSPGSRILFASGDPYDTLYNAVGMGDPDKKGCLVKEGREMRVTPLNEYGKLDFEAIRRDLEAFRPNVIYLQRSRGYAWRDALNLSEIKRASDIAREVCHGIIVAVDNCYGEFTCGDEPVRFGADIMAGSLIKNPGGGIAPTGGYIAGKRELVELCGERLTVPGMGREVGSYAAPYTPFYQGIFLAPHVVLQAKKVACLAAMLLGRLGFEILPEPFELRNDIVQSVRFDTPEQLIDFCRGVQMSAPVDSYVTPEPSDMPGYEDKVIMAAGSFIQGSSIEWSADGPLRPPYTAYIQGGLTYEHGKLALLRTLSYMAEKGSIKVEL